MKKYYTLIGGVLLIIAALMLIQGCKYDVAEPQWDLPFSSGPDPVITSVVPDSQAAPGVNSITINGQNFSAAADSNDVWFGTYQAEVVSNSATSITVRRPNLVTESVELRVSPRTEALVEAVYNKMYKIDAVKSEYGTFVANIELMFVAVDKQENVYTCYSSADTAFNRKMVKVTPSGEQTILPMKVSRVTNEAKFGPDGRLYLFGANRTIEVADFLQQTVSAWTTLPSGKTVRYGDFDPDGYLYTGGNSTDLMIVAPDSAHTATALGVYSKSQINAVRVYNGFVYLGVKAPTGQSPAYAIWRHAIVGSGVLGTQELVLDWSASAYSDRTVKGITFSTDGVMYIATDSPDPLLIADPTLDIFYKSILTPYCKAFYWGSGNYIYMLCGNTTPAEKWKIYRVDMGTTGAPYGG